ncbi:MAG TPA: M42 family metallopeptidase [bacterium]|nr:M42 family metallopeptidase [bacterium]
MEKKSMEFLKELMGTAGPSGFETETQRLVFNFMKKNADEVESDVLGNVKGVLNPKGKPRIMLAGHCDEIGLILQHINNDGYLYFQQIGGTYLPALHGQRVYVVNKKGRVLGVIGRKKGESTEVPKSFPIESMWIDIGVRSRKEAEKLVSIGDPITFATNFQELPNNLVLSKGFDDKIAVFAITEILKRLSGEKFSPAVFGVSTVQEELGTRGATTSSFSINPDIGIAIDVIEATDYPDIDKRTKGEVSLGKGLVLHRGANINPVIGKMLIDTAVENGIPYQVTAAAGPTGTDARAIQLIRGGVATALISIPLRYMHTSGEIISLGDIENIVKLVVTLVKKMKKDMSLLPL